MAFTLPPLPYDYATLEPHIDARTMEIHHTKVSQSPCGSLLWSRDGPHRPQSFLAVVVHDKLIMWMLTYGELEGRVSFGYRMPTI